MLLSHVISGIAKPQGADRAQLNPFPNGRRLFIGLHGLVAPYPHTRTPAPSAKIAPTEVEREMQVRCILFYSRAPLRGAPKTCAGG